MSFDRAAIARYRAGADVPAALVAGLTPEEHPTLLAYDQDAFVRRLGYDRLDLGLACELFRLNRRMTADLLDGLEDADFDRAGTHTERGHETLADLVEGYVEHLAYHERFAREKRERLGRPLPA